MIIKVQKTEENSLDLYLLDTEILDLRYHVHLGGDKGNLMRSIANMINRFKPIIEQDIPHRV